MTTLFDYIPKSKATAETIEPWEPRAVARDAWPPDYRGAMVWRMDMLHKLRSSPALLEGAKAYYAARPVEFILDWCDTYDPRKSGSKWIPFIFFPKQVEFVQFLAELRNTGENGLIEKCRDVGATWGACAYSVHCWLFRPEDAIGWGSRKEDLVDKIGDPSSIFEKLRLIVNRLPDIWRPIGLEPKKHMTFMKMLNPENGSVIIGETGDNIGRGGRTGIYLKDESAHYERPEKIEAALGDNTNVQVDISSVNGLGNVFHRRREAGEIWQPGKQIDAGVTRIFIFDWRDHPEKSEEWYNARKTKYMREGMSHVFAQEVDRDYSAAIANTIIPMEYINAAVDAHLRIKWQDPFGQIQTGLSDAQIGETWGFGLDVADDGADRNGLAGRQGIVWRVADEWGERDPGVATRRTAARVKTRGRRVVVQYDCIGIGASVKSEFNRLVDEKLVNPEQLEFVPWNAGAGVMNPADRIIPDDDQSPMNGDIYQNLKAQAWWALYSRFYKTYQNLTHGTIYPVDELISLDSAMPLLAQIKKELAQPTSSQGGRLKQVVDKKPNGTRSPNIADAGVMMYFPIDPNTGRAVSGQYGG